MVGSAFAELQRAPALADQIYLSLRTQLRAGTHAPGDRLVESALAQELSVSRSPVREVLARLTADGLLENRANRFYVVAPTMEDMAEIFEMRRLLEPQAARHVARQSDTDLMDVLADALARTRTANETGDFVAFVAANYDFRAAWVAEVPNQRLRETILRFDDQAGFVRRTTLIRPGARTEVLALLDRFTAAFKTHDEGEAAKVAAAIVDGAERHTRAVAASD